MKKKVESMIAIGERVKKVRKALKFQQKEMAASLKMSASYFSEIESAHAKPGPEFFIKLSRTYNVSLEYLLLGRGDMFYDQKNQIPSEEEYTLEQEIDSIEQLVWLMRHSPMFKYGILAQAAQFIMDNESFIKNSLEKAKKAQLEEKKEPGRKGRKNRKNNY